MSDVCYRYAFTLFFRQEFIAPELKLWTLLVKVQDPVKGEGGTGHVECKKHLHTQWPFPLEHQLLHVLQNRLNPESANIKSATTNCSVVIFKKQDKIECEGQVNKVHVHVYQCY